MKRYFMIFAALSLLFAAGCAPKADKAQAERIPEQTELPAQTASAGETTSAPFETIRIEAGESALCDLDGDGTQETIGITAEENAPDAEEDETVYTLYVRAADGTEQKKRSEVLTYKAYALIGDMNEADQSKELFFTQIYVSDDLVTDCLRYEAGSGFIPLYFDEFLFFDTPACCYGAVEKVEDGLLTVNANVDVLGSRGGVRDFVFKDGCFTAAPDSIWDFTEYTDPLDEESWLYFGLKLKADMPASMDGGGDTISAGDTILITGTDAKSFVRFVDKHGKTGTIAIEHNDLDGWGWLIAGRAEQDYFEDELPYAG